MDIKKKLHSSDVSDIEDMTREILQRSQRAVYLEVADVLKCLETVSINTFSELLKWIESDDFATLTAENCIVTIVIDSLSKFAVMDNKAHGLTDETELTPESLLQFGSHLNQVASILLCPVVISTSVRLAPSSRARHPQTTRRSSTFGRGCSHGSYVAVLCAR